MRLFLLYIFLLLASSGLQAQELTLSGYVKDMQGLYYLNEPLILTTGKPFQWTTYNQIHNRLNLKFQGTKNLRFELGVRNRMLAGKLIGDISGYADLFKTDNGLKDLSWNLTNCPSWFLNTSIDRIYIDYTWNKVQLKIGRQRINWGIDLVWNPNDLFNASSYLDFDYEERPGSDAILLTWYTSGTSSLDIALKADRFYHTTVALRYLFNFHDYDIQFIGGKDVSDLILGGGWSGNIGDVSFRGESTFFTPLATKSDTSKNSVSATISVDYTFSNSLYFHSAFLFNSTGTTKRTGGISLINPNYNMSAKQLSLGKYELFAQISYPVNPILSISLASMYNPSDHSSYLGPASTISLQNDLELLFTSQVLLGETGSEYGAFGNTYACFGRLRWSF